MIGQADKILSDLVLIKSTSEDSAAPIVDYVTSYLKRLGLEPRFYGKDDRPAVVAQFGERGVMLSGHLDTVPPGTGWSREVCEVSDGRMYGRGTCDMKGGCTAMLIAAQSLMDADVPFSLCFTTDEETTMNGAGAAAKDPAIRVAPAVVVAEPSDFEIVLREKGLLQFSISTKGQAAHASMPHLGDNAIRKMVAILSKLDDLQRTPEDAMTGMTMSVDTISGGTRINVIPSDCSVEVDVRYPTDMNSEKVLRLVRDRIGINGYDVKVLHELEPVATSPDSRAVRTMMDVIGPSAELTAVPYATEMVMFKNDNKVLMVCGPGDPKVCHTVDECIDLRQVVKGAEIYTEYCSRMAGA